MTWTYSQSTGDLTDPNGRPRGTGYSGFGDGYNNPAMQSVENIGPCPQGLWAIGASFTHPLAGPVTMRLSATDSTMAWGRSGFLLHGDTVAHATDPHPSNSASDGCIVLPRALRELIDASTDRMLMVTP